MSSIVPRESFYLSAIGPDGLLISDESECEHEEMRDEQGAFHGILKAATPAFFLHLIGQRFSFTVHFHNIVERLRADSCRASMQTVADSYRQPPRYHFTTIHTLYAHSYTVWEVRNTG